jgi:hypothetical protein
LFRKLRGSEIQNNKAKDSKCVTDKKQSENGSEVRSTKLERKKAPVVDPLSNSFVGRGC